MSPTAADEDSCLSEYLDGFGYQNSTEAFWWSQEDPGQAPNFGLWGPRTVGTFLFSSFLFFLVPRLAGGRKSNYYYTYIGL